MKICLNCGESYQNYNWTCTNCKHSPLYVEGYPVLAPYMLNNEKDFNSHFFHQLTKLENGNFWFESRNKIIIWAIKKYFSKATSLLEIGCGTGFVLSGIHRTFPNLSLAGSDIFIQGLNFAKNREPKVTLFQMDACNIPFKNEFDIVGVFDVLEHIDQDKTVLTMIHRAIKPGGGCIITVPQHYWLWSVQDEIACHKRRYNKNDIIHKMNDSGFTNIKATSFISLLLPLMIFSRLNKKNIRLSKKLINAESEFQIPKWLNNIFSAICSIELVLLKKVSFPLGGSLLLIGRKE
jgi:SAM-dependent methyltransferase